jgi:hypothetical protein
MTDEDESKQAESSGPDEEGSEECSAEEQQPSEDGSAYTESPKPVAAAETAQAGRKTTGEAASRPHMVGPFARCDLDSLSVVMSMLSSDDFLSAIRVNKQFYAARLKKSAWPALQLDSFIQSLRDDDYENPARRRLRLRIPNTRCSDVNEKLLRKRVALFAEQSPWRFVTDVQLFSNTSGEWWNKDGPSVDLLLHELGRLPCLTAVNFHLVNVSAEAFEQFCTAVAPRLQVLLFECLSVPKAFAVNPLTHVGLLYQLRVLVVDEPPPLPALLQLHQLVYLHIGEWRTLGRPSRSSALMRSRCAPSELVACAPLAVACLSRNLDA